MAISVVGAGPTVTSTGGSFTVGTSGLTLQANDLAIVMMSNDGDGAITGPTGWTQIDLVKDAGNWAGGGWYHVVTGPSDNSWSVSTPSGNAAYAVALVLRGTDTTTVIDKHSALDSGGSRTIKTTALSTTNAADMLVCWFAADGASSSMSITPTGLTNIVYGHGTVNCAIWVGYQQLSATGTTAAYQAGSSTFGGVGFQFAVLPGASGPSDPFPAGYEQIPQQLQNAVYRM